MKTFVLTTFLLLAANLTYTQSLHKGNLVGLHLVSVDLKSGVTMDQFTKFVTSKVIPEYEKHFKGVKGHLLEGIRGENKNSLGFLFIFKSEQERDKYFNEDGGQSELGQAANAKMQPVMAELDKLGTTSRTYTDWIVK